MQKSSTIRPASTMHTGKVDLISDLKTYHVRPVVMYGSISPIARSLLEMSHGPVKFDIVPAVEGKVRTSTMVDLIGNRTCPVVDFIKWRHIERIQDAGLDPLLIYIRASKTETKKIYKHFQQHHPDEDLNRQLENVNPTKEFQRGEEFGLKHYPQIEPQFRSFKVDVDRDPGTWFKRLLGEVYRIFETEKPNIQIPIKQHGEHFETADTDTDDSLLKPDHYGQHASFGGNQANLSHLLSRLDDFDENEPTVTIRETVEDGRNFCPPPPKHAPPEIPAKSPGIYRKYQSPAYNQHPAQVKMANIVNGRDPNWGSAVQRKSMQKAKKGEITGVVVPRRSFQMSLPRDTRTFPTKLSGKSVDTDSSSDDESGRFKYHERKKLHHSEYGLGPSKSANLGNGNYGYGNEVSRSRTLWIEPSKERLAKSSTELARIDYI